MKNLLKGLFILMLLFPVFSCTKDKEEAAEEAIEAVAYDGEYVDAYLVFSKLTDLMEDYVAKLQEAATKEDFVAIFEDYQVKMDEITVQMLEIEAKYTDEIDFLEIDEFKDLGDRLNVTKELIEEFSLKFIQDFANIELE